MTASLVIRADASNAIGTGHVMRCLALAQAWRDSGGSVVFAMRNPEGAIAERLQREEIAIEEIRGPLDAPALADVARRQRATWIVVDGYGFDAAYQQHLRKAGLAVLFVDDYGHCSEYFANIVLNQNISAEAGWYERRLPETALLLGTDYVLLRREFREHDESRKEVAETARNVLVTLGGADAGAVTSLALDALASLDRSDLHVRLTTGPLSSEKDTSNDARRGFALQRVAAATEMPQLMQWADVAVSAAGSTCWELLFMQVPFIAISLADNQRPSARRLGERGLATAMDTTVNLTAADVAAPLVKLMSDAPLRRELARRGREVVDGRGVGRIMSAMRKVA